jgi:MSHA biogenesis protein MshP
MSTMRPELRRRFESAFPHHPSVGFTLIAAIFLLVVLSALGVYLVRFSSAQQVGSAQEAIGAQVYQAALAGADYGAYQAVAGGACGTGNLSFPGSRLNGVAATVSCTSAGPYSESGLTMSIYTIVSVACNRPSGGACPGVPDGFSYVERRVSLSLSDH